MQPTGCLRDSIDRRRRGGDAAAVWLAKYGVARCAPLPSSNLVHFGRCGGTREARSTVAESLVALYRVGTHQIRRGRRAEGGSIVDKRESKAQTGRFLKEKLISDLDLFSSHEGRQGAANGQDSRGFFRDAQGFGRLDAGSCAGF